MTDLSIETRRVIELGVWRASYVDGIVQRKVDRNPNVDNATIERWEQEAFARWAQSFPALASMFPPAVSS